MRLWFLALVLCPAIGFASSWSTPGDASANQVAMGFRIYRTEHGVLPKQWSDLKEIYDPDNPDVKDFMKRYAILDVPLDIENPYKVKLLALTRKPSPKISHGNGAPWEVSFGPAGRNLIVEDEKGYISRMWGSEKDITTEFQAAGRVLPQPDQEPEPLYITRARSQIHFWMPIKILLFGIVIWFLAPRIHRWIKWHPSKEYLDPKS